MNYQIEEIDEEDYEILGQLMVRVYSHLDGFPTIDEQPEYYKMLGNIGQYQEKKNSMVLVAKSDKNQILGGIVYFSDMKCYGSGGSATNEKNACGIRLLGVDPICRKLGIGKALTVACIEKGINSGFSQMILHTTQSMSSAWKLYLKLGFKRSSDLDFMQQDLPVFGFRLSLTKNFEQ